MSAILVAAVTFFSTSIGGLAAVRIRDRLHLLLGFSAGAVLGVAFFDVFPELVQRTSVHNTLPTRTMVLVAGGFLAFFLLEKFTALHGSHGHEHQQGRPHRSEVGVVAASGLCVHSFLDGVAIAVGFRTSSALGLVIALAVVAHDFTDGLNTVTVMLAHGNTLRRALRMLALDATTPLLGAIVATVAPIPEAVLPYILSVFVGFFIYIGASELLPEAREHDSPWPAFATVVGMSVLFGVTRVL